MQHINIKMIIAKRDQTDTSVDSEWCIHIDN